LLLRGWDERGFVFFTNYDSRKGHDIAANGLAALLFYWNALERQVRIEGTVAKLTPDESDAYFMRRPRGHRLRRRWSASPAARRLFSSPVLRGRWPAGPEGESVTAALSDKRS